MKKILLTLVCILLSISLFACRKKDDSSPDTEGQNNDVHIHTEVIDTAVAPTCSTTGLTEGKHCSVCNQITLAQTVINALGHDEEIHEAKEPTCLEFGWNAYTTCKRNDCHYSTYKKVPALGHNFISNACSRCNIPESGERLVYELSSDKTYYTVTGIGTYTGTNLIISDNHEGLPVMAIAPSAFYECSNLTSVIIPDSIKSIGASAFFGCTGLKDIIIPNSVKSIGFNTFSECDSLKSIVIGNSVTSIGYSAFSGCNSLANVVIPDRVTSIGYWAFRDCTSLTSVIIPNSVSSIGYEAFVGCDRLTIYCETTKKPGGWALNWNKDNNAVAFGITDYGITENDLVWVKNKGEVIITGYCGTATEVIIPKDINGAAVATIGSNVFYECTALTSVIISDSVTHIGYMAFSGCNRLTSIIIPDSVRSISEEAFWGCDRLTIYCEATKKPGGWTFDWNYSGGAVVFGITDYGITENDLVWVKNKEGVIIAGYCGTVTEVVIPENINRESVTSIGRCSFACCDSLTSVAIPESVISVGYNAFSECSNLIDIKVDENNKYYKDIDGNLYSKDGKTLVQYAIGKTDTSFIILEGVSSIGENAFNKCNNLTSVTIPESVTLIGKNAFYGCYRLYEVINHSSINIIKGSHLYEYVSYYALEVHNGESKICNHEDYLFYTHNDVNYLLGYIGDDTNLTLPESYNGENYEIYQYAFYMRNDIESVLIPESVTAINSAFSDCKNLTNVVFKDTSTWYYTSNSDHIGGTMIDVTNTTNNAIYLKNAYGVYCWYKK